MGGKQYSKCNTLLSYTLNLNQYIKLNILHCKKCLPFPFLDTATCSITNKWGTDSSGSIETIIKNRFS